MLNIVFPVVSFLTEFLLAAFLLLFWAFGVNEWEPLPQFGEMGGVFPVLGIAIIMTSILSGNWVYMFITRYRQCFEEPKTRKLPEYYYQLMIVQFLVLVIHGSFTLVTSLGWIGSASFPIVHFLVIHLIFKILYFGGFTFCVFCWVIEDLIMSFARPELKSVFLFLFLRVTLTIISFICFIIAFVASTGINVGLDTDSMFASIDYFFVFLRMCFFLVLIIENVWHTASSGYFVIKKEIRRVNDNERRSDNDGNFYFLRSSRSPSRARRRRKYKNKKKRKRRKSNKSKKSENSFSSTGSSDLPSSSILPSTTSNNNKNKNDENISKQPTMVHLTSDYSSEEEEYLYQVEGGDLLEGKNFIKKRRWRCEFCPDNFPTEIDYLSHIQYRHTFYMKNLRPDQIEKLSLHLRNKKRYGKI